MRFGNFLFPAAMDPADDQRVIQETLVEAQLCDSLGMDKLWLAEHHFDGICAYVDPVTFAAALAASTKQIKIGFAVAQMSLHHPIRLAEQMALIDNISRGGRAETLGAGSARNSVHRISRSRYTASAVVAGSSGHAASPSISAGG